ncbi:Hypothetical_protein [Hexamita inflata]|uniref:Hypothetical_protein n=1 Tax=Hexamita inflata TaxID=28002 RepID=A0AA86VCI2_9EUKA|nr:Hypothetical protein HINF_LOCUS50463 [Hexamita inflata]
MSVLQLPRPITHLYGSAMVNRLRKVKIPRFKVLSQHHQGSVWLRAINEPSLNWKAVILSFETQVVCIDRLTRSGRVTLLDACTRVVGCLGCGGAPNVHRCVQNEWSFA